MNQEDYLHPLSHCNLCEHRCGVNRLEGETGICRMTTPAVASATFHSASPESYTVFMAGCNYKCLNCQNWTIAQWAIELLASQLYKRYLTITKSSTIRIARGKVRQAQKYDGKWVLETNDDTISMQDAASGYKGLMVIERCFRSLKRTQIKMCPMFHWIPRRIETHVRICVLSLLIERVAEIACQQPWSQIRHQLQSLQVTEFLTLKHRFFRRNKLVPEVYQMLKTLTVAAPKSILSVENLS